jgi:multicomponent Na+:H+ antiporter subunit A
MSPLVVLGLSALGTALAFALLSVMGRAAGWVAAVLPAALFLGLAQHLPEVAAGSAVVQGVAWVPALGIDLALRLDGFSLLFALLITGIGALVTVYAGAYFAEAKAADRTRFLGLILLFMTAMLGTVMADNLVVMFVFWELTSLVSFFLIGFKPETRAARDAALQSLLVTAGGGLALLAGIILLGIAAGTFSFSGALANAEAVIASPLFPAIVACVLVGAFTKSAQWPFHFWLPNAMQAPTPASAYLHSATMVKLGVYLLARFDQAFGAQPLFYVPLLAIGGVTMLVAALQALRSEGFKAVLAYSTVASLGTLVMLIGLQGPTAALAVVGFLLAHALYKAALFFCAGTVIHATGVSRLRALGGLAGRLPVTAIATVLASLSMAGLPFFAGYAAKELLVVATLSGGALPWVIGVGLVTNIVLVAVAGVVTLRPFFKRAPEGTLSLQHGETFGLGLPPVVLALTGILVGTMPALFAASVLVPAAGALAGQAVTAELSVIPGLTAKLALTLAMLAIGLAMAWFWGPIHRRMKTHPLARMASANRIYDRALAGLMSGAGGATRVMQTGSLRAYATLIVAVTAVALVLAMLGLDGAMLAEVGGALEWRPYLLIVLALMVAGAAVAAFSRSLLAAIIGVGMVGYAIALVFLKNGAPDLAFTQFSVETLFLVILMALLLRLPIGGRLYRAPASRPGDLLLAATIGVTITLATVAVMAVPFDPRLSSYFGATAFTEAFGRNVVNVILVDFRALDTLGEIAVVGFAAIAVWALLRGKRGATATSTTPQKEA